MSTKQETQKVSRYSVHPGVLTTQAWVASLKEKTGRTLQEWIALVKEDGPPAEKERREWLKKQYGLGTNAAWWIAERAEGKGTEADDPETYLQQAEQYVADMFAGPKRAGLLPLYEELLRVGKALGSDVRVCPCKTIVPLYRQHVFAQLKPSTGKRIDLGLALGDTAATGRLIATGGLEKGDRITLRVPIASLADIDDNVKRWLKAAYDRDAL
jgi:hypothetical protein